MPTDELTPEDFGVARAGIHLFEVEDGDQWYLYGHHEPGPAAEAINRNNRAQGYSTLLSAADIAEVLEHTYVQRRISDDEPVSFDRCEPGDPGAAAVTVVTL
ncbi:MULTISPECIES: hypothetical protein [unclassified Nocardia]|uniref:hypothetical protein n=1 Tax=unclassified Nocardia TaxID=2637762 RepID=UPI001CE49B7D|nr:MULTISPECIES: hypothetical protein [unclassified Nocardia]